MVAEHANPCDTQLSDRDALAVCNGRQVVHDLEVMSDVLGTRSYVSRWAGWVANGVEAYVIMETAETAPEIALSKVIAAFDMTGE